MIHFKPGVKVSGMTATAFRAVAVVLSVFERHGLDLVVTSITDGKHMPKSLHYEGKAFDIRLPSGVAIGGIVLECRKALGPDFDVVWEPTHIHVEYDPA